MNYNTNPGYAHNIKTFSYRGAGSSIDYKTDGTIQQASIQAQ